MNKKQIGRRIRIIIAPTGVSTWNDNSDDWVGLTGTVIINTPVYRPHGNLGIELDRPPQGCHTLNGKLDTPAGIWIQESSLVFLDSESSNNPILERIEYLWQRQNYTNNKLLTTRV